MNAMLSRDPLETEQVTCGVAGASLLSQTLTFPVDKLSQMQLLAQVRVFEPDCLLISLVAPAACEDVLALFGPMVGLESK